MNVFGLTFPTYLAEPLALLLRAVGSCLKLLTGFLREPWVVNAIQVMLFSTCLEAARRIWQAVSRQAFQSLLIEVRIDHGDFAWDWCNDFLAAHGVWEIPTSCQVVTQNKKGHPDGYLQPLFRNTSQRPLFWKWRGQWIKIFKQPGTYDYRCGAYLYLCGPP